jgi:hypothetical protein
MTDRLLTLAALAVLAAGPTATPAYAVLAAYDDASQAAYNDGWQNGDNGGAGFGGWTALGNGQGFGSGGGFIANNNPNSQIGTGSPSESWGVFGNGGGVGQATRPFLLPLSIGATFSMAMDNGFIDGGGTVGFGLQNSSGFNLVEYYFVGGQFNYTVSAQNVSGTTPGFTNQGMLLSFTLTSLNSFLMTIDVLPTLGVDHVVTGNLNNSGNQAISQVRVFNSNAGFGGDHDAFYNMMSIDVPVAVPELSAFAFGGLVCCVVGVSYGVRTMRRKRAGDSLR